MYAGFVYALYRVIWGHIATTMENHMDKTVWKMKLKVGLHSAVGIEQRLSHRVLEKARTNPRLQRHSGIPGQDPPAYLNVSTLLPKP